MLMRFSEARRILDRYCIAAEGKSASTNKTPSLKPNENAAELKWWLEHLGSIPPADGPRSRAYLQAYLEIAGPRFFAKGIPLADGYLLPDRGVMKSLLYEDYVRLSGRPPVFLLTEKGEQLVTTFP